MSCGRLFQSVYPVAANAQSPTVRRWVRGTSSCSEDADCRRRRRRSLHHDLTLLKYPHFDHIGCCSRMDASSLVAKYSKRCTRQTTRFAANPHTISLHNRPADLSFLSDFSCHKLKQEAKGIWQRLHRMTPRTRHAAYTARAAADLSCVTDRLTDRQTDTANIGKNRSRWVQVVHVG